ncbi:hypothetical protein ES705_27792 [subsurface metagenome]
MYKIIFGGTLIDGTGTKPIKNTVIHIKGKKIAEITDVNSFLEPKEASYIFDARNKFILPGFIDCHTHIQLSGKQSELQIIKESIPLKTLRAAFHAKKTIEAGFTSIRDLGAENLIDIGLRDAIDEGLVVGPRMFVSGYKIAPVGVDFQVYPPEVQIYGRETMNSPEEVRKAVRTLLARGVDIIKLMTSGRTFRKTSSPNSYALTLEEAKIAVCEAHNQNKKVAVHAHGEKGVKIALQAGCDSLEHGTILDNDDTELMRKNAIFLVPTLSFGTHAEKLGDKSGLPDFIIEKAIDGLHHRLKSFEKALKDKVKIAMGSDAGMPFVYHGENAFELTTMVEAGMTPMQAILSITSAGAELLGIANEVGIIRCPLSNITFFKLGNLSLGIPISPNFAAFKSSI